MRNVEALIVRWFGMVSGVFVPSRLSRTIAMWLPRLTARNERTLSVLITLISGASASPSVAETHVCRDAKRPGARCGCVWLVRASALRSKKDF